jgi:hypothetical protein
MIDEEKFVLENVPNDESLSVALVNYDRLYQNIFTDELMPHLIYSIELQIEFEYYPVSFNSKNSITLAYDINQTLVRYITIPYSSIRNNQWCHYQTTFKITTDDGFHSKTENCLIIYFYNPQKTKFYLKNCKVKAVYRWLSVNDEKYI